MTAGNNSSTAAAMEAYMNLACLSAGISPGTSAGISPGASAGTSAKSIRKPKTSLIGIKKSGTGSVTKPFQRKSLDPKLLLSGATKTPYLGATKWDFINLFEAEN